MGPSARLGALAPFALLTTAVAGGPCLCVFDIDRTLTGKQGDLAKCPWNAVMNGVTDTAYGGGTLTLSDLAQHVAGTFCAKCYIGVISAGDATGDESEERQILHQRLALSEELLPTGTYQSGCTPVKSPLVTFCPDGQKQTAMPGIIDWYRVHAHVEIADEDVHFYDDRVVNIESFRQTKYNAHQIACGKRDLGGSIGYCGARIDEVVPDRGVLNCEQKQAAGKTLV